MEQEQGTCLHPSAQSDGARHSSVSGAISPKPGFPASFSIIFLGCDCKGLTKWSQQAVSIVLWCEILTSGFYFHVNAYTMCPTWSCAGIFLQPSSSPMNKHSLLSIKSLTGNEVPEQRFAGVDYWTCLLCLELFWSMKKNVFPSQISPQCVWSWWWCQGFVCSVVGG